MPIIVPDGLPASERLASEGISVISRKTAKHQDIRPQEIAILNLMPNKQRTEKQLARLLGDTPLQVGLTLLRTGRKSKHESEEHLETFYEQWEKVQHRKFDGLIITGAPVEHLDWNEVDYWSELRDIFNWSREQVHSRLSICWGGQAALQHQYGIEKYPLPKKAFGAFPHQALDLKHPLAKGFDDEFTIPVSRHTEMRREDIVRVPDLQIVAESEQTGLYLVQSRDGRDTFCFNHPEYGAKTLKKEFDRDIAAGKPIELPVNYFPNNDPTKKPLNRWRSHASALYRNWLNVTYQDTPYDLEEIPRMNRQKQMQSVSESDWQI